MSRQPETITVPGAVDVHGHFREPSPVNKAEDFESGSRAALVGGFVCIHDMPNTEGLPTTSLQRVLEKRSLINKRSYIPAYVIGGVDVESQNISEIEGMLMAGVDIFKFYTDVTTGNDKEYPAAAFEVFIREIARLNKDALIMLHSGKDNLQDFIDLVALIYRLRLHHCHTNTPEDVKKVIKARLNDLSVTNGVTPDHLFLTADELEKMGVFGKRQPPVDPAHSEELLYNLRHGGITMIETDHAPHSIEAKLEKEPYGTPNIEFSNRLLLSECEEINKTGKFMVDRFVEVTSTAPARLVGMEISPLTQVTYEVEESEITEENVVSKAGWTPFMGKKLGAKVVEVALQGRTLLAGGKILPRVPPPIYGYQYKKWAL